MTVQCRFTNGKTLPTIAAVARADGVVTIMRTILSLDRRHGSGVELVGCEQSDKVFEMSSLWARIAGLFDNARKFYSRSNVEVPGLLWIELRLKWISGYRLAEQGQSGGVYGEDEYPDWENIPAERFLNPDEKLENLRKKLIFGFDLETPEGM